MRKWTVEVNMGGGFFEKKITFVIEAPSATTALRLVHENVRNMHFKPHEYQAHIV